MNTNFSSADTSQTNLNGVNLAYKQFGHGEPIIFYNRFRGIIDYWDPLFFDTLARDYTVVVFDYAGTGSSEGELSTDLNEVAKTGIALMEKLGHKQFHVGGWSYGGLVAQAAMFQNKDRVLKTVLIGTDPPGENKIPMEPIFGQVALKPTYDLEDETILFFEPESTKSRQAAKRSHERIIGKLDWDLVPSTPEIYQRYMAGMGAFRKDEDGYREAYKNLHKPVLVISGDHDISFNPGNWFPLMRNAPSVQQIIIHDAGHGVHHQFPELLAGYVYTFLSKPE